MLFGTDAWKVYSSTYGTVEPAISDYEMKAEYNLENIVYMKSISGKRTVLDRKLYHKFTIDLFNVTTTQLAILENIFINNATFSFYPHKDNTVALTGLVRQLKPYYDKNRFFSSGVKIVIETNSTGKIEQDGQHVIHEAWDWDIYDTSYGLNGTTYTGVGTYTLVAGKLGNCIKLPSGANYFGYVNGAWLIGTGNYNLNFWFKFDATAGYGDLMAAGTSGLAAQAYRLTKNPSNGNGTVNLSLTIDGVTRATDVVLAEDEWHMATISVSGGDVWIHINNVLEFQAGYTTANTHIYMGQGIGATKTFDAYIDEMVLVLGFDITFANVAYWYNNGAGRAFVNNHFWY